MATELGNRYRDRITLFEGTATGKCSYISGCSQTLIIPFAKDGAIVESQWFDDQRLEPVPGFGKIVLNNSATPGPDKAAPKR